MHSFDLDATAEMRRDVARSFSTMRIFSGKGRWASVWRRWIFWSRISRNKGLMAQGSVFET